MSSHRSSPSSSISSEHTPMLSTSASTTASIPSVLTPAAISLPPATPSSAYRLHGMASPPMSGVGFSSRGLAFPTQPHHVLPPSLEAHPLAHLYTSQEPDLGAAVGQGKYPLVGRRQRVSVACTYCRRRKIRCCGSEICSNCSRANRICEYSAVTEESMRREREMNARRRRTEPGHPAYSLAPAPAVYGFASPVSPPLPSTGFAGPAPAWTTPASAPAPAPAAYQHRHTIDLASPMHPPHSPSIPQGPFASPQIAYHPFHPGFSPSPKSSITGYNGGWQRTHPRESPEVPSFQCVPAAAPIREAHGSAGARDRGVFGVAPTSVFGAGPTPSMTPPSRGMSPHRHPKRPKLKTMSMSMPTHVQQGLVSPPCSPDVFAFGQSFPGAPQGMAVTLSAYQPSPVATPQLHGLNIMMPSEGEMKSMFSGVEGMESAVGDRMAPPPYIMGC